MTGGIRWMSVGPGCGYGNASEAYRSGLRAGGVPVSWTPLGWPSTPWRAAFGPMDTRVGEHGTVVVQSTPWWHERLAAESAGRLLAAYTTWETDRLPGESAVVLNRYDRVLVPSRFNAEVFASSGVRVPVEVVPHIAPDVQTVARGPEPGATRFVFYLIASWLTRKAIPDAVAAYLMAFGARDDVVLVIHTTPEDLVARARGAFGREVATSLSLARALAGHRDVPEIVLSNRSLPPGEVDRLHRQGDCFVSLSRGEGWGLGAFEAAAFGNPAIVTGWSGTREFWPRDYPYFVDYDLIPTTDDPPDAWWQPRPGERWAKAHVPHAAALLRHVYDHREEARAWGRAARSHVRENFGSAAITRRLLEALGPSAG